MPAAPPKPTISVIIPIYRSQDTVTRALNSVIRQSFQDFEIIVVDDASPDESAAIAKEWAARNSMQLEVVQFKKNRGPSAARNAGASAARAEYIAFLDSDDEWLPDKLAAQLEVMERDHNVVLVGCNAEWIAGNKIVERIADDSVDDGPEAWKALLESSFISTPCAFVRASAFKEVRGFREDLTVGEDQDLWIRLAFMGNVIFIDDVLVHIHIRSDSLMKRATLKAATQYVPMIEGHVRSLGPRLSRSERRRILGRKYGDVGRDMYVRTGSRLLGLRLIAKAIIRGYRPIEHAFFLIHRSPFIIKLRGLLSSMLIDHA